jgi:hypothetical protein
MPRQVDGIGRLAALLQQVASERGEGTLTSGQAGRLQQSVDFLRWLLAEAATLSPDARTAALW